MALQHPEFERFKSAYQRGDWVEALACLDRLQAQSSQSAALCWHRARTLQNLGRVDEAASSVDQFLRTRPDYLPALLLQVELDWNDEYPGTTDNDDDAEDDAGEFNTAEYDRREHEASVRADARTARNEQRLRHILQLDPSAVDAMRLLSELLRFDVAGDEPDATRIAEADQWLTRALELAPKDVRLLEIDADQWRMRAVLEADHGLPDSEVITDLFGMDYSIPQLKRAATGYLACAAASGDSRFTLNAAQIFHQLQRYDEALDQYDQILASMAEEDPRRPHVLEMRARSESRGQGERESMAGMLEHAIANIGTDRRQDEDMAAQVLLGAAAAVREGQTLQTALADLDVDDPDTLLASSIAQQILNLANEPPPQLERVDSADFPAYQRKFCARQSAALELLGMQPVAQAEAARMRLMLGQRVLLNFHADDSGETGITSFCMKPKWPGLIGYLLLRLSGKWKTANMVECASQFADGAHISTQYESISPFEYAAPVYVEKLPAKASLAELISRHSGRVAEYRRAHPGAAVIQALDLAGFEHRWLLVQQSKQRYRQSIGYITDAELTRMLGAHTKRLGPKVRQRLQAFAAMTASTD